MANPDKTNRLIILNLPHPRGLLRELAKKTDPSQENCLPIWQPWPTKLLLTTAPPVTCVPSAMMKSSACTSQPTSVGASGLLSTVPFSNDEALSIATQIAGKILQREVSVEDQQRLLEESLRELQIARRN